jgi:DNA-binding response OmpR family regulator
MSLPTRADGTRPGPPRQGAPLKPRARILLAEDDEALRALMAAALAKDGHEIIEARDGSEVLELLACNAVEAAGRPVDLIVSDVRMPGWSGLDVLAGLSRDPTSPAVVLVTAFGDEELHANARRLGARATMDKPFDMDELRAVVKSVLASPSWAW